MSDSELHPINIDDHRAMDLRRRFSGEYALQFMDFYEQGFNVVRESLGQLAMRGVWLDIGTNSMLPLHNTAIQLGITMRLVGLDPNSRPYKDTMLEEHRPKNPLVQAVAEKLPFADDSITVASLYNTVFRLGDAHAALREIQRVVMPGGLVLIGTNGHSHAGYRHGDSQYVAEILKFLSIGPPGFKVGKFKKPAEGYFTHQVPSLIAQHAGLQEVGRLDHDSRTVITADRIPDWLQTIKDDKSYFPYHLELYDAWEDLVDDIINPRVRQRLKESQPSQQRITQSEPQAPETLEPAFEDIISRSLFVLKNNK